jgi:lipopolysaccharide transport system ATP-binding protein
MSWGELMQANDYAIKVQDLSKLYRIGVQDTVSDTFGGALLGFLKQPLNNFRKYKSLYNFDDAISGAAGSPADNDDILWALRDVSFNVERGEAIGVIGRNGAGKSTLLKVLSRITHPTSGRVEIDGRVSSLLEVGTGFHPELTGRENIYLNGTVLGMKKVEVDRKFDDIVEFSGVERFLNTPVKRYSSGMTVRLAFAVAAHLDPEILIVDEVLAVGDAAFQEKCIGTMKDATKVGRTVLFVSHNMAAVSNLCSKAIYMQDGQIVKIGDCDEVIEHYLSSVSEKASTLLSERADRGGVGEIKIMGLELLNEKEEKIEHPQSGRELVIRMHYASFVEKEFRSARFSAAILKEEIPFILLSTDIVDKRQLNVSGSGYLDFIIPRLPLSKGTYHINTFLETGKDAQDCVLSAAEMHVIDGDFYGTGRLYPPGWAGKNVLVDHSWRVS